MFLIGLLYLLLEDVILADFTWDVGSNASRRRGSNYIQRTLTGIQVRTRIPLFLLSKPPFSACQYLMHGACIPQMNNS